MRPDTVYIDIATSTLTLSEIMTEIETLIRTHPDESIFLDGDAYAIVGRQRTEGKA